MKRFFDDEGEICTGEDLTEAERLFREAFTQFVDAGYMTRDWLHFTNLQSNLLIYDFEIDRILGENHDD